MDDLISRAEAIDAVEKLYRVMLLHTHDNDLLGKIVYGLEHLPSAQPEIIRCKDCEHWDTTWENDFAPNYHYCPLVDGTRRGDFYCADADMRGEQDDS